MDRSFTGGETFTINKNLILITIVAMLMNEVFEYQKSNKKTNKNVLFKALFKTITKNETLKMALLENT